MQGECVQEWRDHKREVTVVRWTTADPSPSSSSPSILASASLDCTVRLYDVSSHKLLHTLTRHTHPITSLSFQPGAGGLLASGSHDRVHVWSVGDGQLVKTFRGEGVGGVNEVAWDGSGSRIMVAYADSWNYCVNLRS